MSQKLATATFLKQLTGEDEPQKQYETLCELGILAVYKHGRVRVPYDSLVESFKRGAGKTTKPRLNL